MKGIWPIYLHVIKLNDMNNTKIVIDQRSQIEEIII